MSEKRTIRVKRSYLVKRVQTYEVDIPADMTDAQVDAWRIADPVAFDEHVCDGHLVAQDHDLIDNDDLDTQVSQ